MGLRRELWTERGSDGYIVCGLGVCRAFEVGGVTDVTAGGPASSTYASGGGTYGAYVVVAAESGGSKADVNGGHGGGGD